MADKTEEGKRLVIKQGSGKPGEHGSKPSTAEVSVGGRKLSLSID